MDGIIESIDRARESLAAALGEVSFGLTQDAEIVALLGAIEAVGRLVDVARVASATEVGKRSDRALGHDGLSWRYGCRNAADLVTRVTRVSSREANRRLSLGAMVADRVGMTGGVSPLFPAVAKSLASGELGVDAAEAIVTGLRPSAARIAPEELRIAERSLVASATGAITVDNDGLPGAGIAFAADLIRQQTRQWVARLDADGPVPGDGLTSATSEFGFGSLKNGVYPFRGGATPELFGVISTVMDAYLSAHAAPAFPTAEEQARMDAGEIIPGSEVVGDDRTGAQKRADILMGLFGAAARSPETPRMGGAAPVILVHVDAEDLLSDGTADTARLGWIEGVSEPIALGTVKRLMCAGGVQKVVIGKNGEVLHLGEKERYFTPAQRRALAARDGGCVIPGCSVPAHWCEIHHVIPWYRHGKTDLDNGVLLCWFHHHTIETSGWDIRMIDGVPHIKAPPWLDATGTYRVAVGHRLRQARRRRRRITART